MCVYIYIYIYISACVCVCVHTRFDCCNHMNPAGLQKKSPSINTNSTARGDPQGPMYQHAGMSGLL